MLLRLEDRLRERIGEGVRVCRVDFQGLPRATSPEAYRHLARTVARVLPQAPQAPEAPDAPALVDFLEDALAGDGVQRLVLLLDELGTLPEITREDLAHVLRALHTRRLGSQALAKAQFVLAGGIELYRLAVVEASALRNVCEIVRLGDLGEDDAVAVVADGLGLLGVEPAAAHALGQAVYARVGGHPYLTQRLGEQLAARQMAGDELDEAAVEELSWGLLEHDDPLLEHLRRSIGELRLEEAARRLLSAAQRTIRTDDGTERLDLLGLARRAGRHWAPRCPLLGVGLAEWLGLPLPAGASMPDAAESVRASALRQHLHDLQLEQQAAVSHIERAASTVEQAWVPALVKVPAGPFLMGSSDVDKMAESDEKPQHLLELPDFWIGKTPVTNVQFGHFVEGDGYINRAYWTQVGWVWREQQEVLRPAFWDDSRWSGADHPVVGISWFEAVAYCRWLSAQIGHTFKLPNEAEWEKAARGPAGFIWPWGNTWETGRCNTEQARVGKSTPVSRYAGGASLYGVLDLAGNVWEWCSTRYGKIYPYQLEQEWVESYLEASTWRRLRGGAYYSNEARVRGAFRGDFLGPDYRHKHNGFRVTTIAPLPGSEL